ncbi:MULTISPECIES: hypothetical protein [Shewanella]|uniref:Uncharacterized protein n=1 Tax=Shewanella metallivivens TaxID=2872342 RepID=A0ABT5TNM6_9GAMM|nr:hypothetical protein [Shewanella metallivivens]MDD8060124.1 hypothetical protein [Shewanella metallivivens]
MNKIHTAQSVNHNEIFKNGGKFDDKIKQLECMVFTIKAIK